MSSWLRGCGRRWSAVWRGWTSPVTNAFRWVHGEGDLLPGIHVDYYADAVVVRFDGDGARAFYRRLDVRLRLAAAERCCRSGR